LVVIKDKRTSVKGKDKVVPVINYAFKTCKEMKVWHHVFLTSAPKGLEQPASCPAMIPL
jgi:hypothetical protein